MLGVRYPAIEIRVELITRTLNAIFEKEHTLNLDRLATISKRDARQFLRDLVPELMHPFVEAFVMLYSFEGHAIPVDAEILALLVEEGVVDESTILADAQKFLEHNIKAEECHDFFTALRKAAHADEGGRKKGKK